MTEEKNKGVLQIGAEKMGEVIGELGQRGWEVVKSFEKGLKKGLSKDKEEK